MLRIYIAVILLGLMVVDATEGRDSIVTYRQMLKSNAASVSKIQLGMTKEEVQKTMGTFSAKLHDEVIPNPWRVDEFVRDGETYEVLYYLVVEHPPFAPLLYYQATPIVLKNGVVVGIGSAALSTLRPQRE